MDKAVAYGVQQHMAVHFTQLCGRDVMMDELRRKGVTLCQISKFGE
jgi:hypothetical protein